MLVEKVNFFVVGAPKCGTSWLAIMLQQHPQIFIPEQKEIHYFNQEGLGKSWTKNPNFSRSLEWYLEHFNGCAPHHILGDLSPSYLASTTAANKIYEHNKDAKIIIMMRNPVERSFSDFLYRKQMGWLPEKCTFEQACSIYPDIVRHSQYADDISKYAQLFSSENILLIFNQDITHTPQTILEDVARFLGITPHVPDNIYERKNETGVSTNPRIMRGLALLKIMLFGLGLKRVTDIIKQWGIVKHIRKRAEHISSYSQNTKPSLSQSEHLQLINLFADDISQIEKISGRKLDAWKLYREGSL